MGKSCCAWMKKMRKAQRPFAISIARASKQHQLRPPSFSQTLPIKLKARETLTKRSLSPMVDIIPSSTLSLVSNIRGEVLTAIPPTGMTLGSFRKQLITPSAKNWTLPGPPPLKEPSLVSSSHSPAQQNSSKKYIPPTESCNFCPVAQSSTTTSLK